MNKKIAVVGLVVLAALVLAAILQFARFGEKYISAVDRPAALPESVSSGIAQDPIKPDIDNGSVAAVAQDPKFVLGQTDTAESPGSSAASENKTPVAIKCLPAPPISGLDLAKNSQLRQLEIYQEFCSSKVFSDLNVFTNLPASVDESVEMADQMGEVLQEFRIYGVSPIVIVEPVDSNGDFISFKEIGSGAFDAALNAYFSSLKLSGADDQNIGLWVPFPEPNINEWGPNNNRPGDFSAAFNRYAAIFKRNFPQGRLSPLLDNYTYDPENDDYSITSLHPYLEGLNKAYLWGFGLQGFPSAEDGPNIAAPAFLDLKLASDSALLLGVKSIWLNTGTFATAKAESGNLVRLSADDRAAMLNSILANASDLKNRGYRVAINLFAQDKRETDEGIDWSYLKTAADQEALFALISNAAKAGIPLWFYDDLSE